MLLDEMPPDEPGRIDSLLASVWGRGGRVDASASDQLSPVRLEYPEREARLEAADYLIKGIVARGAIGTLVGPSGVGKTTLALHMAYAIACGHARYQGRRVRRAPVLYVAYEGDVGIRSRLSAASREYGDPGRHLARLLGPELLSRAAEFRGVNQIIAATQQMRLELGEAVGLIVVDTKSRATAGDDEDSNSDAAAFVETRLAVIVRETGAAVMTVHHTGKDATRGGRGASALRAADDFTLVIDTQRSVHIDKARDGPDGIWFSYRLETIELGSDADGDPVTACVVRTTGQPGTTRRAPRPVGAAGRALEVLERLYTDGQAHRVPPVDLGGADVPRAVHRRVWRDACRRRQLTDTGNDEAERKAASRASSTLEQASFIASYGDYIWLLGQSGHVPDKGRTCPGRADGTDRDTPL